MKFSDLQKFLGFLRSTNSLNEKEKLLMTAQNIYKPFMDLLELTLDPFRNYKVTSKIAEGIDFEFLPDGEREPARGVSDRLIDFLFWLSTFSPSRAEVREELKDVVRQLCRGPEDLKLVLLILDKDLDIGVGIKLFNKVVPKQDQLPTESCMLCKGTDHLEKYFKKREKLAQENFGNTFTGISPKFNGHRAIFNFQITDFSVNTFFTGVISRNGKPYHNYDHFGELLKNALVSMNENNNIYGGKVPKFYGRISIDGEILNPESLSKTMTQARRKYEVNLDGIKFVIFDIIDHYAKEPIILEDRIRYIHHLLMRLPENCNIEAAKIYDVDTIDEVWSYHDIFVEEGYEGAVIKDLKSVYEFKKSENWVKVKKFDTLDLTVIGYNPHSKDPHILGSLVCDYEGKELKIGSGFTDEQRIELFGPHVIGRTAEVQYQSKLKNTLEFPVFKGFRDDK